MEVDWEIKTVLEEITPTTAGNVHLSSLPGVSSFRVTGNPKLCLLLSNLES